MLYKYTGINHKSKQIYKVYGYTTSELFNNLQKENLINWDDYELKLLQKYNKTYKDFWDKNSPYYGELDYNLFDDFINHHDLNDDEMIELLKEIKRNVDYITIEMYDFNEADYIEI
jgi:hypothetical protein